MAENNSEIVQDLNNNEEVTNEAMTAVEGATASGHENHAKNDNELLDMVFTLESEKQQLVEESRKRMSALRKDLEVSFFVISAFSL